MIEIIAHLFLMVLYVFSGGTFIAMAIDCYKRGKYLGGGISTMVAISMVLRMAHTVFTMW